MSLLRKQSTPTSNRCECTSKSTNAVFRMTIEPEQLDVREAAKHDYSGQLENAARVQKMFLPHLNELPAHQYGDGYHMHPERPSSVAHLSQLPKMLDQYGLCTRISLARGHDHSTRAAPLEHKHVQELLTNGIADVKVPLSNDTFRLHSNEDGRITAVEYVGQ